MPLSKKQVFLSIDSSLRSSSKRFVHSMDTVSAYLDTQSMDQYEKEDIEWLEELSKIRNKKYNIKSVDEMKEAFKQHVIQQRHSFYKQLQHYPDTDLIPEEFKEFFSHSDLVQKKLLSLSTTRSETQSSVQNSVSESYISSSFNITSVSSYLKSIQNSFQYIRCSNSKNNVQTIVITKADDIDRLVISEYPRLYTLIIEKNSIPYVSAVVINNNPKLIRVVIEDHCGNESIRFSGEGDSSRVVKIGFNSSLQTISIGNNCFKDFSQFEVNSLSFVLG